MNVPLNRHQPVLRWLAALRRRSLWQRAALALGIAALAAIARAIWLPHNLEAGRDLLLLLIALVAFVLGLVPGLFAGVTVRGISIWWFGSPAGAGGVAPWNHPGVTLILLVTIIAAALAGQVILLLAERDDQDRPPR